MTRTSWTACVVAILLLIGFVAGAEEPSPAETLRATEVAFAQTMADRDLEAFRAFLAEDTVFFTGGAALRGRQAVVDAWARFFEGETAPFAWAPEQVEVLDDGSLGFSTGPILDPGGEWIGTFNSVWRRQEEGWRIVFDRGCPPCPE